MENHQFIQLLLPGQRNLCHKKLPSDSRLLSTRRRDGCVCVRSSRVALTSSPPAPPESSTNQTTLFAELQICQRIKIHVLAKQNLVLETHVSLFHCILIDTHSSFTSKIHALTKSFILFPSAFSPVSRKCTFLNSGHSQHVPRTCVGLRRSLAHHHIPGKRNQPFPMASLFPPARNKLESQHRCEGARHHRQSPGRVQTRVQGF